MRRLFSTYRWVYVGKMALSFTKKIKVKVGSWQQRVRDWRDLRDVRPLDRVTVPSDFQELRFVSPTRSMRTEMLRGPNREPETREWVERIPQDQSATLWDVGANVGSFTIYAAKRGVRVVAVEPMPHNLLMLVKNVILNQVSENVVIVPLAMSHTTGSALMHPSSFDFGSARHSFGREREDASKTDGNRSFGLAGISLGDAPSVLGLPAPTHLKVDVDGLDDEIIYGASRVLDGIREICCEVRFDEVRISKLREHLESEGFTMMHQTTRNHFFSRK